MIHWDFSVAVDVCLDATAKFGKIGVIEETKRIITLGP